MMNGRPAWAVRTLMGAAELYITLLSVCERLLKALKSQLSDTVSASSRQTSTKPRAGDGVSGVPGTDTKARRVGGTDGAALAGADVPRPAG